MLKLAILITVVAFVSSNAIPNFVKSPEEGDLFEGDMAGINKEVISLEIYTHIA
jgi:hypothetical protein